LDFQVAHCSYLFQWIHKKKLTTLFILSLVYPFLYPATKLLDAACTSCGTFFGGLILSQHRGLHFSCESCFEYPCGYIIVWSLIYICLNFFFYVHVHVRCASFATCFGSINLYSCLANKTTYVNCHVWLLNDLLRGSAL